MNVVRVCFLGSVVYHRVCVCEFFACLEGTLDFFMIHDKHCICALLTGFVVPLHHTSKVFPKCSLPNIRRGWIMHEFFVSGDDFPGDGMYHLISVMFNVWGQLFYSVLHKDMGCAHGHQHFLLDGEYINSLLCHDPLSGSAGNHVYCCHQNCCLCHRSW